MSRQQFWEVLARAGRLGGFVLGALSSSLRHNLGRGLLAIALSTSIWIFITNEQNPPRTGIFPIRVPVHPVNVTPDLDILGQIDSVVVRITAPSDLWDDLSEASFDASVDLSRAQRGDTEVKVQVRGRDARVRVLEVVPSQVLVRLDVLKRQVISVKVNLQQAPPPGFSYQDPVVDPPQVTVLGPEGLVSLVDVAIADVNLSDSRTTVKQSFPLVPRTARGYDIAGVRVEPQNAVVEVPIVRQISYATLPILPEIKGIPAPGYWVSGARVEPISLGVVGPQDVLQPIGVLKTQPVDVSNVSSSFTKIVGVDLPNGVTLAAANVVQVRVTVEPLKGTAVFQIAPQILGVSINYIAEAQARSVEVTVSGEGPALQNLKPNQVSVLVNLNGESPGVYLVEPQVRLPAGFQLLRVSPATFSVTIR